MSAAVGEKVMKDIRPGVPFEPTYIYKLLTLIKSSLSEKVSSPREGICFTSDCVAMTNSSGTHSAGRERSCSLHLISCRDFLKSPEKNKIKMMSVCLAPAESAHLDEERSFETLIGAVSAGSAGGRGGVSRLHPEWIARGDAGSEEADLPSRRE